MIPLDLPDHPGAACAEPGVDPAWFYPPTSNTWRGHYAKAVQVCRRCPIATRCLAGAIERGETHGVWGGRWFGKGSEAA